MLAWKSLTIPVPKEHHNIKCRHSCVAGIILQIGWETSTIHGECGQLNLAVNIYCRLYWAHVLIIHYLRTGSTCLLKYMHLINMHLLTRLCGIWNPFHFKISVPASHIPFQSSSAHSLTNITLLCHMYNRNIYFKMWMGADVICK